MNHQDRGDKLTSCAHHWCRRMKRGWTPVRAIVRLQKQVIGYQGSICQTCVSVRRTLALWKPDGREGTSVKGACVSARFKCKTSSKRERFHFWRPRKLRWESFTGEHLLFFRKEHNDETLCACTNWQEVHWPISKCHQHIPQFHWFNSLVKIHNSTCKLHPFSSFSNLLSSSDVSRTDSDPCAVVVIAPLQS